MATDDTAPSTEAPPATPGILYENPSSKALRGPPAAGERDGIQRVMWRAFFVVLLGVVIVAVVLGMRWRR